LARNSVFEEAGKMVSIPTINFDGKINSDDILHHLFQLGFLILIENGERCINNTPSGWLDKS
jgi:hypothetical protein